MAFNKDVVERFYDKNKVSCIKQEKEVVKSYFLFSTFEHLKNKGPP